MTKGTGPKNPTTLEVSQMSQVTYRGNQYDPAQYRKAVLEEASRERNFDLMYRGTRYTKKKVEATV